MESFYRNLEFGTGGLRGIMGVGTNRINKYTIGTATQGFANFHLKRSFPRIEIRVAIAHDSRNNSRFFAETTANVFAAHGIKVFLFQSLRPTPEFELRDPATSAARAVSSVPPAHNPKGIQRLQGLLGRWRPFVPPHDKNVYRGS